MISPVSKFFRLFTPAILLALDLAGGSVPAAVPPGTDPQKIAPGGQWLVNDPSRPKPPKAQPKPEAQLAAASKPPAGATVLFDGKDLSQWQPSQWKVENGYVEIIPKSGNLVTKESFGSVRLHLEWWNPPVPQGEGQKQGNSGVFLMGRYEMQVLDNTNNNTYADGLAGAVYGENPPRVDASRPSGQWQTYDIAFHRPEFDEAGKILKPARITAWLNGVKVQDDYPLSGPTNYSTRKAYEKHPDKLPLELQDHASTARYRNIWIQPLP